MKITYNRWQQRPITFGHLTVLGKAHLVRVLHYKKEKHYTVEENNNKHGWTMSKKIHGSTKHFE